MKFIIKIFFSTLLILISLLGIYKIVIIPPFYSIFFLIIGLVFLSDLILQASFYKTGKNWETGSEQTNQINPIKLKKIDYLKALISWIHAFKRTYVLEPGLYYSGEKYDPDSPLLVTSNYFLSVFLILYNIKKFNVRLLIIDTDGINVWCAAGKGQFSHDKILKSVEIYKIKLNSSKDKKEKLKMILPKFCLSGVNINILKKSGIKPIIGPLYAKDLPNYLKNPPYKNRNDDRVHFNLKSRTFTWLPGFIQFLFYSTGVYFILWILGVFLGFTAPLGIIYITVIIATAYPLLFPWIPGKKFAVKGISLGLLVSLGLIIFTSFAGLSWIDLITAVIFTLATGIFMGLSYTGNSAVSNYSRVRKETAQFLPLNVLLYVICFIIFIVQGVN